MMRRERAAGINSGSHYTVLFFSAYFIYYAAYCVFSSYTVLFLTERAYSATVCGIITSLTFLANLLMEPVGGYITDTFLPTRRYLLLLIGMIILGRKFAATTAYCSILLSVTLSLLERICPMTQPLTDQPMLELCFAIALPALGSAVLFNIGSSSGGTDIIAMILKKYSSFDIGHALLASDILITIAGFFVFDIKTGLYSLLGLTVRSFMVDSFIESLNLSKYFNVVCDHPEVICDFIVHTLNRSASVCHARGAYSGQDKYIILTALNRAQAVQLRNFIRQNEPTAFILISNTSEIIGKGFHSI